MYFSLRFFLHVACHAWIHLTDYGGHIRRIRTQIPIPREPITEPAAGREMRGGVHRLGAIKKFKGRILRFFQRIPTRRFILIYNNTP